MTLRAATAPPWRLIRHHGATLRAMARFLLHAALPKRGPTAALPPPVTSIVAAPPDELVEHYIAWSGAQGRYAGELPPHMVSQWSLPLVSRLLLRMPYPITRIINQGVALRVHGPLPRGRALHLQASVESAEQVQGRIKVVIVVNTGIAGDADASKAIPPSPLVEARLHMSFMLPGPRAPKSQPPNLQQTAWQAMGAWQANADDGLRFALLSGDFNPIHWCGPLARRSHFGGTVLHGFGSLVRSYELLERGGFNEIDVRFVKPVPLPSAPLTLELAPPGSEGWRPLRLSGLDGALHLAGRLR